MLIYEIPGTDNVIIDDIIMEGFINENKCTKCDNYLIYSFQDE